VLAWGVRGGVEDYQTSGVHPTLVRDLLSVGQTTDGDDVYRSSPLVVDGCVIRDVQQRATGGIYLRLGGPYDVRNCVVRDAAFAYDVAASYSDGTVVSAIQNTVFANFGDGLQRDADGDGVGDVCEPACDDGLDNDRDGLTDTSDPGCADATDLDEHHPTLACDDGADNDGDGLVDLDDPGCPVPAAEPENPACDDGLDNDGDGFVDFEDPECDPGSPYWETPYPCGIGAELVPAILLATWIGARRRRMR
jgi:hypothetical protein